MAAAAAVVVLPARFAYFSGPEVEERVQREREEVGGSRGLTDLGWCWWCPADPHGEGQDDDGAPAAVPALDLRSDACSAS